MAKRIVKYKILSHNYSDELEKDVEKHIADDWQPFHGVSIAVPVLEGVPAPLYAQAMIKEEET